LPLKDIKEQFCTQVEGENNCNGYTKGGASFQYHTS
jgi:hypothetical protein